MIVYLKLKFDKSFKKILIMMLFYYWELPKIAIHKFISE